MLLGGEAVLPPPLQQRLRQWQGLPIAPSDPLVSVRFSAEHVPSRSQITANRGAEREEYECTHGSKTARFPSRNRHPHEASRRKSSLTRAFRQTNQAWSLFFFFLIGGGRMQTLVGCTATRPSVTCSLLYLVRSKTSLLPSDVCVYRRPWSLALPSPPTIDDARFASREEGKYEVLSKCCSLCLDSSIWDPAYQREIERERERESSRQKTRTYREKKNRPSKQHVLIPRSLVSNVGRFHL